MSIDVKDIKKIVVEAIGLEAKGTGTESDRSGIVVLVLLLFLGGFSAHRFYVGRNISAVIYLITFQLMGVGYIIDLLQLLRGKFVDKDGNFVKLSN